jgi:hypothetical protein
MVLASNTMTSKSIRNLLVPLPNLTLAPLARWFERGFESSTNRFREAEQAVAPVIPKKDCAPFDLHR